MKIKTKKSTYEKVINLPRARHKKPKVPPIFFRFLMKTLGKADLKATDFTCTFSTDIWKDTPCLILMNHSSWIDLEIASSVFYPKPFGIVCTSDGFVGKEWLMRNLGCIPTKKFVTDISLISDISYALNELKMSVLMYPEASYSFDGTATPLPRKMGILLKKLGVPVIMVKTCGAFARDPLYNCLQKRKVKVSAEVSCLFKAEELKEKTVDEIDAALDNAFSFDYFAWQEENNIEITEAFRADGLERILYRCAACGAEGQTEGKGISFVCKNCHKEYVMDKLGRLSACSGATEFPHIPDWYAWERKTVKEALENGTYMLDTEVDIGVMVDYKAIYMIGGGRLTHNENGFTLKSLDGKLTYTQPPTASYSLYSDYFWYELGDIICIGTTDILYYCFPKTKGVVAKTRLAAEELYKIKRAARKRIAKNT